MPVCTEIRMPLCFLLDKVCEVKEEFETNWPMINFKDATRYGTVVLRTRVVYDLYYIDNNCCHKNFAMQLYFGKIYAC